MNGAPNPLLARILDGYAPHHEAADELFGPDGAVNPVWTSFISYLDRQSVDALARRFARGDQYLHDAGVLFRQYSAEGSAERDWPLSHIPVLVSGAEWRVLAEGLVERAELLEAVMADLYGPGRLVADGHLPASLVAENPEWWRPLVGVRPVSGHYLHHLAFEVGRSPDGSWLVMGDRTQAPSGAGFALENRMATSKVFSDHYANATVERLAGFFRRFRDAMAAPGAGRAAILTPGPNTDTYFEHAYLARYLGLVLLEGEDLRVTPDGVMVQTVAGPEPVATLWRRLDSRFADPLELSESSAIGTPGLVSSLRAGQVGLINALGSGVLESRAFLAFLPKMAEAILGHPLAIPNIATWWCGQPTEQAFVRDHRARMMLGLAHSTKMPFEPDETTFAGDALRGAADSAVDDLLASHGAHLVGQETVRLSTTPAMIGGALRPRPMVLRVFAARTATGWTIMPGGYSRIGRSEDPTALAMQRGGSVADVWVMGEAPARQDTLAQASAPHLSRAQSALPARTADNLYWLGRYVDRAEGNLRLLRAYHQRREEAAGRSLPVLQSIERLLQANGLKGDAPIPPALLAVLDSARNCASKVRERFSTDGWRALSDLADRARDFAAGATSRDEAAQAHGVLLRDLAGFSGLVHENMFQDTGWRFLSLGRALERADHMVGVLIHLADPKTPAGSFDVAVEVGDSQITHRRRYAVQTNRDTVIDLLALDPKNPRGIAFQVEAMARHETTLPRAKTRGQLSEPGRRCLTLSTELAIARPRELTTIRLSQMRDDIRAVSTALSALYFG